LDVRERKTKYYSDDQIKEDEMGGACRTCRRTELHLVHWYEDVNVNDNLEDLD
jgi:hypothetical protein